MPQRMRSRCSLRALAGIGGFYLAALGGCSPAAQPPQAAAGVAGSAAIEPSAGGANGEGPAGVSGLIDEDDSGFVAVGESDACVIERATSVQFKEPVDIIVIVDNSVSMDVELAATERNINENFASILEESALDYRVILISQHRRGRRTGFNTPADTMVCVERPLSGIEDCTAAPEPVFSERFFHYSTRVESDDSLDILLDTYAPPFDAEAREDEFGSAPLGWSEWLRPGAKKIMLELTDDNEDLPADDFLAALTALAPEHFGSGPGAPTFVFHSIVGLLENDPVTAPYLPGEGIVSETCAKVQFEITSAGEVYQELSRRTGGLRFPICQSSRYDVVFREIAGDVFFQSEIACDFPVPDAPAGRELDLDRVSVTVTPPSGAPRTLGQARLAAECQSDAFFIEAGRIQLCAQACTAARAEPGAQVDVLFGCESAIIVR
jgi:hypothetical protein